MQTETEAKKKEAKEPDGFGSPYANTLIPLQRLHSLAFSYRGSRRPLQQRSRRSHPLGSQKLASAPWTFAYANGSIAKVLSSDKDQASSPHDGLLKDNPPPSQLSIRVDSIPDSRRSLWKPTRIRVGWTTALRNVSDVDGLRRSQTVGVLNVRRRAGPEAERRRWTFRCMPLADQRENSLEGNSLTKRTPT